MTEQESPTVQGAKEDGVEVVEFRIVTRTFAELAHEDLTLIDLLDILKWAENWLDISPYAGGTRSDTRDALNRVWLTRDQVAAASSDPPT